MKQLLLIISLFACQWMSGQHYSSKLDSLEWDLIKKSEPTIEDGYWEKSPYSEGVYQFHYWHKITYQDLLDYSTECYADSTKECGYHTVKTKEFDNGLYEGYDEYQCQWLHKKPTFEGFIEFMKHKYGIK